jgi:hypothetical protein
MFLPAGDGATVSASGGRSCDYPGGRDYKEILRKYYQGIKISRYY